jgi:hypothetical protein
VIYHGEVNEDSDGPVEWCWPVPEDQAAAIGARFPDLSLRTESAHQEAFIHLGQTQPDGAQWHVVAETLFGWVVEQHRRPGGGARAIFIPSAAGPAADTRPDCDFAVPLR